MARTINNMSGIKQLSPTNVISDAGKSIYIKVGGYDRNTPTTVPDLNETVPEEVSSGTGNIVISARDGEAVIKTKDDGSLHVDVTRGNVVFNVPNGSFTVNAKGDHIEFADGNRTSTVKGNQNSVVEGESGSVVLGSENTAVVGNAAHAHLGAVENIFLAELMNIGFGGQFDVQRLYMENALFKLTQYDVHVGGSNVYSSTSQAHIIDGPAIFTGA